MPETEYRSDPAISQSSLKAIARSPAHFRAGVEEDKDETRAMVLGRVAGQLALEPKRDAWWTVQPDDLSLSTTEGKQWAREQAKWDDAKDGKFPRSAKDALEKKGVTVLSFKEFKRASEMAGVLSDSEKPEVRQLLDDSDFEVSGFADVETPSGIVPCKFRADIVPRRLKVLADLKTCIDSRQEPFLRNSVMRLSYYVQAASYLALWNEIHPDDQRNEFQFLAIESSPPYGTQVHRLDADFIRKGLDDYIQMLSTYALCKKMDTWEDYPSGIVTLSIPKYAVSRIE